MASEQFELMRLFQRKSEKSGRTYFSGRLGSAKVVVFRDDRVAEPRFGSLAEWVVLISDGQQPSAKPATVPSHKPKVEQQAEAAKPDDRAQFNDDIPF